MKKTLMPLFLLLTCSLAMAAFQYQSQPQSSRAGAQEEMKFTGCLQKGGQPDTYVLNNASPAEMEQRSDESSMDRSQPGDMPSGLARTEMSYSLIPEGNVNLQRHIGKKVEITGTMSEMSSPSRPAAPSGQSSARSGIEADHPQIKVSSIRELPGSCEYE